jgi:hypothetical protein
VLLLLAEDLQDALVRQAGRAADVAERLAGLASLDDRLEQPLAAGLRRGSFDVKPPERLAEHGLVVVSVRRPGDVNVVAARVAVVSADEQPNDPLARRELVSVAYQREALEG